MLSGFRKKERTTANAHLKESRQTNLTAALNEQSFLQYDISVDYDDILTSLASN